MNRTALDRDYLRRRIFPFVRGPQRYAGGEINSVARDPAALSGRIALAFPDLYEIGACNLGLSILYQAVNREKDLAAERVFMVEADMAGLLRQHGLPLYSLETFTPLRAFDLVGFTLQYELNYTNVPAMLELGNVPLRAEERKEDDPVVVAGGPLCANPMPLAGLVDAFCIGDGEEAVIACLRAVTAPGTRSERIRRISEIPGFFVPAHSGAPFRPARVRGLGRENAAPEQLVPLYGPVQDRYAVEVMRGCPHGCRFCSASFYYRPVREREGEEALSLVQRAVREQGWREVSLLSLSTADYGPLSAVMREGLRLSARRDVEISVPSTRIDRATAALFNEMDLSRRTGITLAPEAGGERLRRVINKRYTDEEIVGNVELALQSGFRVVKLYFMVGLPTETEEDVEAIVRLIRKIQDLFSTVSGRAQLNVSVSPFCPKPGTPFEAESLLPADEMEARMRKIRQAARGPRVKIATGGAGTAVLETVLSRGGKELSGLILAAFEKGLLFQSWGEHFDFPAWLKLFEEKGIDVSAYLDKDKLARPLPWEGLRSRATADFLREEYEKAMKGELTGDCTENCDHRCGICGEGISVNRSFCPKPLAPLPGGEGTKMNNKTEKKYHVIFYYSRMEEARFIPIQDMTRLFERALRIAGAPLAYSEGFSPHPRMSFFCALPLGCLGEREMFTAVFSAPAARGLAAAVNAHLPAGLAVLSAEGTEHGPLSESAVTAAEYEILPVAGRYRENLAAFMAMESFQAGVRTKGGLKQVDLRKGALEAGMRGDALRVTLSSGPSRAIRVHDFLRHGLAMPMDEILQLQITRKKLILSGKNDESPVPSR